MSKQNHTAQEIRVLDVFKRHVASFSSGDLDAVLRDFGEHSVVVTPDGVYEGVNRIRTAYSALLAEFGNIERGDSPGLTVDTLHVCNDTLFITWHAASKQHIYPFGTDTFICDGDKFTRQSIAFSTPQPRDANFGVTGVVASGY
ncbi:MAG: nuclear transport factor 2 family protein [Pseudomonadota bacterium]